jgi:hypothetical protein
LAADLIGADALDFDSEASKAGTDDGLITSIRGRGGRSSCALTNLPMPESKTEIETQVARIFNVFIFDDPNSKL